MTIQQYQEYERCIKFIRYELNTSYACHNHSISKSNILFASTLKQAKETIYATLINGDKPAVIELIEKYFPRPRD